MLETELETLQSLEQESANLLVDPAGNGEPGPAGAVLHPQLGLAEQDGLHGGERRAGVPALVPLVPGPGRGQVRLVDGDESAVH